MELTPGDKQRIYEEEKARLESQERLKAEMRVREIRENKQVWIWLLGVVGFIVISIVALLIMSGSPSVREKVREEARANREEARANSASLRADKEAKAARVANLSGQVLALNERGVIQAVDYESFPVKVYVGSSFYSLSYQERELAIKTVSDLLGGVASGLDVYDGQSGRKIYEWKLYKLEPK